jgi:hypothetical protein
MTFFGRIIIASGAGLSGGVNPDARSFALMVRIMKDKHNVIEKIRHLLLFSSLFINALTRKSVKTVRKVGKGEIEKKWFIILATCIIDVILSI